MSDELYSARQGRSLPQIATEITEGFWKGVVSLISSFVGKVAFGIDFPSRCQCGSVVGLNENSFRLGIQGNLPQLQWPLQEDEVQTTDLCFDLLEYLYGHVAEVSVVGRHKYFNNNHEELEFERLSGQSLYRRELNLLFRRNGLAYSMNHNGQIEVLYPTVLTEEIKDVIGLKIGDSQFDELIVDACTRIIDRHVEERIIAVKQLWDAWERLKELDGLKKTDFLDPYSRILGEESVKQLNDEAKAWTDLGNTFQIRHSEKNTIPVEHPALIEYLFFRMLALILLILVLRQENASSIA